MTDYGYIAQVDMPGGLVKVGRSSSPERRIVQLAQANPYPLRTICFFANGAKIEKELKARLAPSRVRGEWFEPTADLVAAICEYESAGDVVQRVVVDEAYVSELIAPKLRAYIQSRGGNLKNNSAGDLVYRILNGDPLCFVGREHDLLAAAPDSVTANEANGWRVSVPVALVSLRDTPAVVSMGVA